MTKQQAPAPKPKKIPKKMPSRGMYIDFVPRSRMIADLGQPQMKPARKPAKTATTANIPTLEKTPTSVRVSRTTVISTTSKKATRHDFLPPKKEEDFEEEDEDLLTELDFEDNTPVEEPEETPEDFMSEKTTEEYTSALSALKVTAASESPFIASVSVDKRPLSEGRRLTEDDFAFSDNAPTSIKEEDFHGPTRNVYASRRQNLNFDDDFDDEPKFKSKERLEKEEKVASRVVSPKDDHSGPFALIIAIALMVIFGGSVGAIIYLAFFQ